MYKKILVPLDGSKLAERALKHLESIYKLDATNSVILLRVIEPLLVDARDLVEADRASELQSKQEEEAKRYMQKIKKQLKNKGMSVKNIIEFGMDPASEILKIAKKENVDLIVMSTHGKSKILHWMFGSVANRVLMHTPISILVVVPEERAGKYL